MAQLPVENKDIGSRIRAIEAELEDTNPQLYRHLALYLQVLRQVLPHRLEQACFHLATQWHAHRYINLESSRRQLLQRRLQELTQRCSSLLTVEQLAVLALQMQQEQRRRRQRRQRQLLAEGLADLPEPAPTAPQPPAAPQGQGSIRLGMSLPLSGGLFGLDAVPQPPAPPASAADAQPHDREDDAEDDADDDDAYDASDDLSLEDEDGDVLEALLADSSDPLQHLRALQDLLAGRDQERGADGPLAAGPASRLSWSGGDGPGLPAPSLEEADTPQTGSWESRATAGGQSSGEAPPQADAFSHWLEGLLRAEEAAGLESPDDLFNGRLPRHPLLLQRWLEAFDQALARRLRNLSHAVNVELLRLGLVRTLVPASLLDALLSGQLEGQAAPANLLRLPLPLGPAGASSAAAPALVTTGLLLRCTDLELEEPRLRTCRRRLLEQRQQLRRMVQQYRSLQQRQTILQAQRLWSDDRRRPGNSPV